MRSIPADPRSYAKRRRTGFYGRMVCEPCERSFGQADDYAVRFLRRQYEPHHMWPNAAAPQAVVVTGEQPVQLKRFALSCLWRAALSGLDEFDGVHLGPFEPHLRQAVLSGEVEDVDLFSVYVDAFLNDPRSLWTPWRSIRTKRGSIRFYQSFVHGHLFHVKVDQRPVEGELRLLLLNPANAIVMPARDITTGDWSEALRNALETRGPHD